MASAKNAPAVKQENLPTKSDDPLAAFATAMQEMGTGFENVTAKDLLIPRLTILQGLSPQVTRGQPEFDESCRVGDIYDVGLGQRFSDELIILPIHYLVQWLEWAPRASKKGLIRIHDHCPPHDYYVTNEKNQMISRIGGNLIQETGQLYCLNMTADGRPSFIPFASTQLKKARKLLTLATNEKVEVNGTLVTPPLFYRTYKLTTVPESNNEGNWMGWKIVPDKPVTELSDWSVKFEAVKKFRKAVLAGEIRGDVGEAEPTAGGASADEGRAM